MTLSMRIAPHLPYLRRFSRAATGSQTSGDAYVAATLEALIEDPSALGDAAGPRVALYKTYTKIWNSLSVNSASEATESAIPADQRLIQITPIPRQAFLLVAVEGAGRELAAEIATDVLIIEDETFIAMDLESLVKNLGHNVIGVARTHSDAVALAKNRKPGLILADIQLADGSSGLDAVNELLKTFEVPVVFITAYPERFLTGERPEPAFLISKPFQPAMVSAVASQALFFQRNSRNRAPRAQAS